MAALPLLEALISDPRQRVRDGIDALERVSDEVAGLSDAEVVELTRDVEELGRLVDALRIRAAAEVDARSDRMLDERLSAQHGCRTGVELIARLTQAPTREVLRRVRLGRRLREDVAFSGEPLPPTYPWAAAAVADGYLGADAALLITDALDRVAHRADPALLAEAEAELVCSATGTTDGEYGPLPWTFDQVRIQVQAWVAALDQDGPDPDARRAERRRGLTLGPLQDGLHRLRGELTPEAAGRLQRLFDAHLNPAVRFAPHPEDQDSGQPWSGEEAVDDLRTPAQKRHDVLVTVLDAAARAEHTPTLGGAAPTLLVHVALEDLASPTGVASIDGIDVPVPAAMAHRIACTGAVQKVVFDRAGRIVRLGTPERVFNAHQRRAIAARDGGCVIPGCTIPAAWCEIHHVHDHAKGGTTHTDNGVMLCWWHHHHLEHSGWDIRIRNGVPEIAAPPWIDRRRTYRPAPTAHTRRRPRSRPRPPTPTG